MIADGEQHDREGEEHVHDPHDDAVEPAAIIGGEEPERAADEERRRRPRSTHATSDVR